jgi:hypothetical protein
VPTGLEALAAPRAPISPEDLKRLIKEALREELTSGDPATRRLLAELLLSMVLKDSTGSELSQYIRNLDTPVSRIPSMMPLGELALIPARYYYIASDARGYARYKGGSWYSATDCLTGGYWYSSTPGDYIEFEFYGTWFDVMFWAKSGVVNIYVDGKLIATVDVSSLKGPAYNLVWHGPRDLSDDYHTVRIEVVSGAVYVVGVMVDPSKNAWRIVPFPYALLLYPYYLYYYGAIASGLYVRGYNPSYPVFAEKSPIYKTYVYTTTALAAGGAWTSAWVDCLVSRPCAKRIYITVYSDVDGTLYIEYSSDAVNVDAVESYSYTGKSTPIIGPIEVKGRYARIRYVNNPTTAQSVFRLYAWFMGE